MRVPNLATKKHGELRISAYVALIKRTGFPFEEDGNARFERKDSRKDKPTTTPTQIVYAICPDSYIEKVEKAVT